VVLCFGGQNGSTVTLSEKLFHSSRLLRAHLVRQPLYVTLILPK
jgi:hypothetical protein